MVSDPMQPDLPRILVTGASGFVGAALVLELARRDRYILRGTYQRPEKFAACRDLEPFCGVLAPETDWTQALQDVDTVIHTAAKVHDMARPTLASQSDYQRINVEGTVRLAQQAAQLGVRRFIFVSSIKVNGEKTPKERGFTVTDAAAPTDDYGRSKLDCERALLEISNTHSMEIVVVRPPLLYGPGVRGNFQSLLKLVASGVPLPLKSIDNRRSFMAIDNLVDLLITCINHPHAANRVFLVSDGQDLSTPDLVLRIGVAMGLSVKIFSVPPWMLSICSVALGKPGVAQRMCESLQVDMTTTQQVLGWNPPINLEEGLRRAVDAFRP